jgi:hypothetical protein
MKVNCSVPREVKVVNHAQRSSRISAPQHFLISERKAGIIFRIHQSKKFGKKKRMIKALRLAKKENGVIRNEKDDNMRHLSKASEKRKMDKEERRF